MQRTFVAIALALTLSCACATYINTQNYVKAPTQVVQDNETAYTNASAITLASLNSGEIDIIAYNITQNNATPVNESANSFSAVYKKLDGKTLSAGANTNLSFQAPNSTGYSNGYAVSYNVEKDSNGVSNVVIYQTAISGGKTVGRLVLTSNTNAAYVPTPIASAGIGKTAYVFYVANNANQSNDTIAQVNYTSYTIGSATKGAEYNLTTAYNKTGSPLSVVWGEALGSNQLYANWGEGAVLKYGTIDVSKGTVSNSNNTGTWQANYTCRAYATDKKWFGDLCYVVNSTNASAQTVSYYARTNSTNLAPLANNSNLVYPNNALSAVYPYGPYLAIFYADAVTTAGNNTYSYDIYNLDTLVTTKARTTFLTTDLTPAFARVVSGGLYTLTQVSNSQLNNGTLYRWTSNVQVGLVLSGSYLTSVLGFIMTIVAGVLLF